jgi:serine protease AprX
MKVRLLLIAAVGALALMASGAVALGGSTASAATPGLERLAVVDVNAVGAIRGIATFDTVPTAANTAALKALGLTVQPMKHLPLALVRGSVSQMQAAVATGAANDVYPDDPVELLDRTSADAIGAATPRANGYTGKGITVAVIDSGCDAGHADLAKRVVHNVKLVSAEYANLPPDSSNTIVVPAEMAPRSDSDIGSGHGTHVSGIIAADGTTDPSHIGVAPGANLVCISIGEVLFTTAVVTGYDFLLDQPNMWNVRVINNSWGNSFQQFDPRAPVAVATRAVADLGVNVFFAAGNSGSGNSEASLNPFSEAPWVTSVASMSVQYVRAASSSNGLIWDNSLPVTIGAGGHTVFTADRLGIYHPDITTPGQGISSSCTPGGTIITCPAIDGNATASGTSMASPHAAGAAAVLLQANPKLTPDQVRNALQATALPAVYDSTAATKKQLTFWQVGYGRVDLNAAVALVKKSSYGAAIASAQGKADNRVLNGLAFKVTTSDFWTYDAPRASVQGTDSKSFHTIVGSKTKQLKVTLSHPSTTAVSGNNMNYTVTVSDAAGKVIGTTTEATGAGTASVQIDLVAQAAKYGTFTFAVSGVRSVSDPDTLDSESALGRVIVLQVAQLIPR